MANKFRDLIIEILGNQADDIDMPVLPSEHWQKHIQTGGCLTDGDLALLASSPTNRAVYEETYQLCLKSYIDRAANSNCVPVLRAAAASGDDDDEVVFENLDGFSLSIVPSGRTGWRIRLTVLRSGFPQGAEFSVKDRTGKVWLTGSPDSDGEIYGRWDINNVPTEYIGQDLLPGVFVDDIPIIQAK